MNNILLKEVWIKSSVEKVFDCFTKSEAMLRWHGKEIELNPEPEGVYKVVFEDGTTILGKYIEIEVNKRIVYSARYGDIESIVHIDFVEENNGVRIKIRQEFMPGQDTSSFYGGWDYFLNILRELLAD